MENCSWVVILTVEDDHVPVFVFQRKKHYLNKKDSERWRARLQLAAILVSRFTRSQENPGPAQTTMMMMIICCQGKGNLMTKQYDDQMMPG